jgi:hypothetical protein
MASLNGTNPSESYMIEYDSDYIDHTYRFSIFFWLLLLIILLNGLAFITTFFDIDDEYINEDMVNIADCITKNLTFSGIIFSMI